MTKDLAVLGSTGSVGRSALQVCRSLGIRVEALSANSDINTLEMQIREFKPSLCAVADERAAAELKIAVADMPVKIVSGKNAAETVAAEAECDTVLNSVSGIAGLRPTLAAVESGKTLALANKESLVTYGTHVMKRVNEKGVKVLPVDSEHSAIFQSLQGAPKGSLKKILLTASGGPFYGKKISDLENVTVKDALNHPNWSMGAKITIDSATLMNKGLEVIEAVHLFGLPAKDIEVLVHRQSIVHSGVELTDGAVIAQLGTPDMRLPIQYALTYPERSDFSFEKLSLSDIGTLTFEKPDTETFRLLPLCIEAITEGGLKPTAVNGANEQAVKLFLEGKIKFLQIQELVEKALLSTQNKSDFTVEDIFETDKLARECVMRNV